MVGTNDLKLPETELMRLGKESASSSRIVAVVAAVADAADLVE